MNRNRKTISCQSCRRRGAVMIETVLVLPLIMIVIVLLIYLGWNFRRFALVTNMDRYVAWEQVTPGSPGPDLQRLDNPVRNPRLNDMFFGFKNDLALTVDDGGRSEAYRPQAHERLLHSQTDEAFTYFSAFLGTSPAGVRKRFLVVHDHMTDSLEKVGMSDRMKSRFGHNRLSGDWRYANGIRYEAEDDEWVPAQRCNGVTCSTTPGEALTDAFFSELDERLSAYTRRGNRLAGTIQAFYGRYPAYQGPKVGDESRD